MCCRYMKSLFLLTFLASFAYAGVPGSVTYQGRLKEGGSPVEGTRKMQFHIFNDASVEVWGTPADIAVPVVSGSFSVQMSPVVDWTSSTRWYLETWVGQLSADKKLSPREEITSQFFALYAQSAENLKSSSTVTIIAATTTVTGAFAINGNLTVSGSNSIIPAGSIIAYGGTTAPTGWFICDGSSKDSTLYHDLYLAIGSNFGGSGSNFNLPDLRGRFIRGQDSGSGHDPDAASRTAGFAGGNTGDHVGSLQDDAFKSHVHDIVAGQSIIEGGSSCGTIRGYYTTARNYVYIQNAEYGVQASGGAETRPKNVTVNYIIKY